MDQPRNSNINCHMGRRECYHQHGSDACAKCAQKSAIVVFRGKFYLIVKLYLGVQQLVIGSVHLKRSTLVLWIHIYVAKHKWNILIWIAI